MKIPANRFVIYFKSDGSNNDWGYKINCIADIVVDVDDREATLTSLNNMPLYVGQCPIYVGAERAAEVAMYSLRVYKTALQSTDVEKLALQRPSEKADVADEMLCLNVLSMMERSCQALSGITSEGPKALVGPHVIHPLLCLVAMGSPLVQIAGLRICKSLLPTAPTDMVDSQAHQAKLYYKESFLRYLIHSVGAGLNVWVTFADLHSRCEKAQLCSELEHGILAEKIQLLQALIVSEIWSNAVKGIVTNALSTVAQLVKQLHVKACEEMQAGLSKLSVEVDKDDLNVLYAVIGVFGGALDGLYPGARALYTVGEENNILEECIVLSPATAPQYDENDKAAELLWKGSTAFGDAFYVVLLSQKGVPLLVPRSKLTSTTQLSMTPGLQAFLKERVQQVVELFHQISLIDCIDKRPVYKPNIIEKDEATCFESPHPYLDNQDQYTHIKFPGAKKIILEFDSQSRTETSCDFIRFYKDENKTTHWGEEKYHGRDGDANWPGASGRPPLIIPADSCVMYFHSDGSNNDWGYKLTAKAHTVQKTEPPPLPPLLHLSILSHLKLLGLSALNNLLRECTWLVNPTLSLITTLVDTALTPIPTIRSNATCTKPLMLESNHPYDHNKDDYIPVTIRGAKHLVITFDEMTATESGCDYVRFYKDNQRVEYWGENNYSGGKDGSNSTWPSIRGRPPLIIPSDSFVLYFHTDGSVNAWGWRMWVTPDSGSVPLGNLSVALSCYYSWCHLLLLREGPAKQHLPEGLHAFKFVERPANPLISASDALILDNLDAAATSDLSGNSGTGMWKSAQMGGQAGKLSERKYSKNNFPKVFIVNARDAAEVSLREAPSPEAAVICTIPAGKKVRAVMEQMDWLSVKYLPAGGADAAEKSGWVQRRSGDMLYLIPENNTLSTEKNGISALPPDVNPDELVVIDSHDDSVTDASKLRPKHPMYTVEDSATSASALKREPQPNILQVLRGSANLTERIATDLAETGVVGLAQECISSIVEKWPSEIPFAIDYYGDSSRLLLYIRSVFMKETVGKGNSTAAAAASSPVLNTLKQRLLEVVRIKEGSSITAAAELCRLLMGFALKQLVDSQQFGASLRPTRALMRTVECKHPYDNNMDQNWDISIPGAKWLKIVFDKRSSTEKDCDYCVIYRSNAKTDAWGPRYSGRANSSDRVWAGVGTTAPCKVQADHCVVSFHSDGSNTDWGFRLICYGIMEEPSEEERERLKESEASLENGSIELACWILDFLAKESNSAVIKYLYAPATIRTLHSFVETMPPHRKEFIVHLLTNMLHELPKINVGAETLLEVNALKKTITDLCVKQHQEETSESSNKEISQLLQALVQAAVITDSSISALATQNTVGRYGSDESRYEYGNTLDEEKEEKVLREEKEEEEPTSTITSVRKERMFTVTDRISSCCWSKDFVNPMLAIEGDGHVLRMLPSNRESNAFDWFSGICNTQGFHSGVKRFEICLKEFSEPARSPVIGMTAKYTNSGAELGESFPLSTPIGSSPRFRGFGWTSQLLYVNGSAPVPFGPRVSPGDVIEVEIDFAAGSVVYYRNSALVGLALGPVDSGAAVELDLGRGPFYPAVSLFHTGDAVELRESKEKPSRGMEFRSQGPDALDMPSWFEPVRESVLLLRSCATREVPASMLSNDFVPQCENKAKVVLESSHPFDGVAVRKIVCIPGADSLTVSFSEGTRMGPKDIIRITSKDTLEQHCFEVEGMTGGTNPAYLKAGNDSICVGDKVVRGPSWDWGEEDGGAGSFGEVLEVRAWKGKPDTGVSVRWASNKDFVGLYRWDYEGRRDLMVVGRWPTSKRPIVIPGRTLLFEVIPADVGEQGQSTAKEGYGWSGAASFNGSSSRIVMSKRPELEMNTDCTVEVWVRTSGDILPRDHSTVFPIVCRQIEVEAKVCQFSLQLGLSRSHGPTTLVLQMVNDSFENAVKLCAGVVPVGVWTHVAATLIDKTASLYVNGVLVGSDKVTGNRLSSLDAPLVIGANDEGQYFRGCMYDLRIWTKGLSASSLSSGYLTLPNARVSANLVTHLLMNAPITDGTIPDSGSSVGHALAIDVTLDSSVEPNVIIPGASYGYRCIVKPNFSISTVSCHESFRIDLERLRAQYTVGALRHDLALVRYVNQVARARNMDADSLLRCGWMDIAPQEEELVRTPVLKVSLDDALSPFLCLNSSNILYLAFLSTGNSTNGGSGVYH